MVRRWVIFCILLSVSACASPYVQPDLPTVHAPELTEDFLLTDDDQKLPLRKWLPEGEPEAVVIALHGFNDYSRAFEKPGAHLAKQGVAVYAYDQRGFGATKSHGIWAGVHNLLDDVGQMAEVLREEYPDQPIYLLGESMGGAVAISAMARNKVEEIDGAILSAPAVWGSHTMNVFYRMTLWMIAHTMPEQKLTGKGLKVMASDNIEMLRELGKDPLVIKETRVDAIYGIVQLMDHAFEDVARVETPMLLLYGAKDQIIPRQPLKEVMQKIKAPYDVAYYPDGYHMLMRDLRADVVLDDIASWVKNQETPLPSGYETAKGKLIFAESESKRLTVD